jgi:cell division protease FtsH
MNACIPRATEPNLALLRHQQLKCVNAQLKQELLGLDPLIDRITQAMEAWYTMPELVQRPVVVCLWGLTGTGKTQLVRSLAKHLGFYDRFVEVQMDGFANGVHKTSLSALLGESGIAEGEPGILVLDEFQRFRTRDRKGEDVKQSLYPDLWALLSDGRLSPRIDVLGRLERELAEARCNQEELDLEEADACAEPDSNDGDGPCTPSATDVARKRRKKRFRLSLWDAEALKDLLKLTLPLTDIMQWPLARIEAEIHAFKARPKVWETDYSRLLVFVCGNLDEMYRDLAQQVYDCDTDADIFHRLTQGLSLIDVKKALTSRFRPEQIARLGNVHVVYPSLSSHTYRQLIHRTCEHQLRNLSEHHGVRLSLSAELMDHIYSVSVFPTQGTRPMFSSVHALLSPLLVHTALWLQSQPSWVPDAVYELTLSADRRHAQFALQPGTDAWLAGLSPQPVNAEVQHLRQRNNLDYRQLLAVHEAGHALACVVLTSTLPQEVKINVASFEGGYVRYATPKVLTRQQSLDRICMGLAGRAAEQWVFGGDRVTEGAEQDLRQATAEASNCVRYLGFAHRLSRTDVTHDPSEHINTDIEPTNQAMEALLQQQMQRAQALLESHRPLFMDLVNLLMAHGELNQERLQALCAQHGLRAHAVQTPEAPELMNPFQAQWHAFANATSAHPAATEAQR